MPDQYALILELKNIDMVLYLIPFFVPFCCFTLGPPQFLQIL